MTEALTCSACGSPVRVVEDKRKMLLYYESTIKQELERTKAERDSFEVALREAEQRENREMKWRAK